MPQGACSASDGVGGIDAAEKVASGADGAPRGHLTATASVTLGRSLLTPIAAPIAYLPIKQIAKPTLGRLTKEDANYATYREHLRKTIDEPFALFMQG